MARRKRPLIELPLKVKLLTASGEFVFEHDLPPFDKPPEVIIWGSRVFRRKTTVRVTMQTNYGEPQELPPSRPENTPAGGPDWSEGPEPDDEYDVIEEVQNEVTYGEIFAYVIPERA
jgi:hypothetical protein